MNLNLLIFYSMEKDTSDVLSNFCHLQFHWSKNIMTTIAVVEWEAKLSFLTFFFQCQDLIPKLNLLSLIFWINCLNGAISTK